VKTVCISFNKFYKKHLDKGKKIGYTKIDRQWEEENINSIEIRFLFLCGFPTNFSKYLMEVK